MSDFNDEPTEEISSLKSFGEHLDEIRTRIIRVSIVVFVTFVLVFINKEIVFKHIILAPSNAAFFTNKALCYFSDNYNLAALCINKTPLKLINTELAGQFKAHLYISFIVSIIVTFPYILWQLWQFIKPGLYIHEKRKLRRFVNLSSMLFFLGVLFAYYIILPITINFLNNYVVDESVLNTITLNSYISNVSLLVLSMGIVFQLPILIIFLTRIGWITPQYLKKKRKIIFIVLLILAAIITPPDVFSQFLVIIPLYMLFEISIKISSSQQQTL